jgi:putative methionine-R-sulfoxide reductase with GAF domain
VTDVDLAEEVRREANRGGTPEERARRAAEFIRSRTGRRWVGVCRVEEARSETWLGADRRHPHHPNFPIEQGLTGPAIRSGSSVVSNDVANDPRCSSRYELM